MCTHYTLAYKCSHTQVSRRCPLTTTTHTNDCGGTTTYTKECGNVYPIKGFLDDDCVNCKMANGLTPGPQTGFDMWADMSRFGRKTRGNILMAGGGDLVKAAGMKSGSVRNEADLVDLEDDFGATAVLNGGMGTGADNRVGVDGYGTFIEESGSIGRGGKTANGHSTAFTKFVEQEKQQSEPRPRSGAWEKGQTRPVKAVVVADEDDGWMWGGMKGFGGAD